MTNSGIYPRTHELGSPEAGDSGAARLNTQSVVGPLSNPREYPTTWKPDIGIQGAEELA